MSNQKLKIAIQKSGRLYEDSVKLLNECGIELRNVKDRLRTESDTFPIEVFFLRDDDIPQYVEDQVADIGIVGENVLYEKNKEAIIVEQLGFGKCRLSLAVPRNENFTGPGYLQGKKIATSYPFLLQQYLDKKPNSLAHSLQGLQGQFLLSKLQIRLGF
jgi:ATP phosphoribosyltransferase